MFWPLRNKVQLHKTKGSRALLGKQIWTWHDYWMDIMSTGQGIFYYGILMTCRNFLSWGQEKKALHLRCSGENQHCTDSRVRLQYGTVFWKRQLPCWPCCRFIFLKSIILIHPPLSCRTRGQGYWRVKPSSKFLLRKQARSLHATDSSLFSHGEGEWLVISYFIKEKSHVDGRKVDEQVQTRGLFYNNKDCNTAQVTMPKASSS